MSTALRITGDAGTRSRMVSGEGLVIYYGFRLSAHPDDESMARLDAYLGRNDSPDSTLLWEVEEGVLWLGAREVSASEAAGQDVVAVVRQEARAAVEATGHPLPPQAAFAHAVTDVGGPQQPQDKAAPRSRGPRMDPDAIAAANGDDSTDTQD